MWGEGNWRCSDQSSVLCLLKVAHWGVKTTGPDSVLTLQCVDTVPVRHTCTDAVLEQK